MGATNSGPGTTDVGMRRAISWAGQELVEAAERASAAEIMLSAALGKLYDRLPAGDSRRVQAEAEAAEDARDSADEIHEMAVAKMARLLQQAGLRVFIDDERAYVDDSLWQCVCTDRGDMVLACVSSAIKIEPLSRIGHRR